MSRKETTQDREQVSDTIATFALDLSRSFSVKAYSRYYKNGMPVFVKGYHKFVQRSLVAGIGRGMRERRADIPVAMRAGLDSVSGAN